MIFLVIPAGIALFLLYNVWRGAPYVPSRENAVAAMIELANIQPGEQACDLGSGDGRIVIALAKAGAMAHGYETNPLLVFVSRLRIRKLNLQDHAFIHMRSLWSADLSRYDIVTVFGVTHIMDELGRKMKKEMRPSARILSNVFKFKNLELSGKSSTVGLYRI